MNKIFYFIILLFALVSCGPEAKENSKPQGNVLERDNFISVMVDFRLAESAIRQMVVKGEDSEKMTKYYYDFMLKKHKITMRDFEKSLEYYSKYPKEMDEIYSKVVARLSEMDTRPSDYE